MLRVSQEAKNQVKQEEGMPEESLSLLCLEWKRSRGPQFHLSQSLLSLLSQHNTHFRDYSNVPGWEEDRKNNPEIKEEREREFLVCFRRDSILSHPLNSTLQSQMYVILGSREMHLHLHLVRPQLMRLSQAPVILQGKVNTHQCFLGGRKAQQHHRVGEGHLVMTKWLCGAVWFPVLKAGVRGDGSMPLLVQAAQCHLWKRKRSEADQSSSLCSSCPCSLACMYEYMNIFLTANF